MSLFQTYSNLYTFIRDLYFLTYNVLLIPYAIFPGIPDRRSFINETGHVRIHNGAFPTPAQALFVEKYFLKAFPRCRRVHYWIEKIFFWCKKFTCDISLYNIHLQYYYAYYAYAYYAYSSRGTTVLKWGGTLIITLHDTTMVGM